MSPRSKTAGIEAKTLIAGAEALRRRGGLGDLRRAISLLRKAAALGSPQAQVDLGSYYREGWRDAKGRTIVAAARKSDPMAASCLGYCYDTGAGVRRNRRLALAWYLHASKRGNNIATSNVATVYRDLGRPTLAYRWWLKAAEKGTADGEAMLDVAYCRHYGIGTPADLKSALHAYRDTLRRKQITPFGFEEAHYHLSVAMLDSKSTRSEKRKIIAQLRLANRDRDYPAAAELLDSLVKRRLIDPCRCRREQRANIHCQSACARHGLPRR